jgi:hypothetical protein
MSTEATERRSFLGIPVEGDIDEGSTKAAQRPLSDLEPLIRAVLDDDTIHSFGWTQYTPYFNDGEPCVFRVNGMWIRTVEDVAAAEASDEEHEDYDYEMGRYSGHPTIGKREYTYVGEYPNRRAVPGAFTGTDEARYDRCEALSDAIETDAFDDVLLKAFGDHARVTIARDGITVDEYSHD